MTQIWINGGGGEKWLVTKLEATLSQ
jgi:hypothetical protein